MGSDTGRTIVCSKGRRRCCCHRRRRWFGRGRQRGPTSLKKRERKIGKKKTKRRKTKKMKSFASPQVTISSLPLQTTNIIITNGHTSRFRILPKTNETHEVPPTRRITPNCPRCRPVIRSPVSTWSVVCIFLPVDVHKRAS